MEKLCVNSGLSFLSMKFPAIMLSTFDYLQGEIAALQSQAGIKRIKIKAFH
jgi:hypothetical protein